MRPRTAGATRRRLSLEPLESRLALATLYVATTGNDAADGSAATPWRTLQNAADRVNPGDTVIVRPGDYAGFHLTRDGTASGRITFQAEDGVTITQRNAVTPDGINLEGADYITIDGFRVVGMPRTGIRSVINHDVVLRDNVLDQNGRWGILTGFSENILIENNVASRSVAEHGIYVSNSADNPIVRSNVMWGNYANGLHMNGDIEAGGGDGIISGALVENNVIYDNGRAGGSGINGDGVQNSIIRNNLIYNTHASGISLYRINGGAGSSGNLVVNNTVIVAADGRWALNIQNGSTNNTVRNNILYTAHSFRGSIDISADSLPGFSSDYNVLMNRMTTDGAATRLTLAQWQAQHGQDQHSLVATPTQLFVNPAAFDFHLSTTSPAVDAGTSQFAPGVDFEGTARPAGSGFDIGADELGTATPPPPPPPPPPTNQAPSDIALSGNAVKENSAAGVVVGSLSAVDPNSGDTHTFSLVNDGGGKFALSGNQLVVAAGAGLNYEAATSHSVVVRATDGGGLSYDESFVINVTNVNEIVSFDVQRGAAQRSYIRYLDLVFESSDGLQQLVNEGRFQLSRSTLAGNSPVNVSLAGKLTVVGNRVTVNFGSQGIGGSRNGVTGNGYYQLSVDADRDGAQEARRSFYRLLGDTNGDRTVNNTDLSNVRAALGRRGTNLNQDVNGDGVVNSTDRELVRGQIGKSLSFGLPLDD